MLSTSDRLRALALTVGGNERSGHRPRLVGLDRLRGLAVLLMVLDHLLVVITPPGALFVRLTATRASLPIFCVVAGALAFNATNPARRLGDVVAAGLVATPLGLIVGIGQPDVLLLLALALAAVHVGLRSSRAGLAAAAAAGVVQATTWQIPWTGYQPGTVLALCALGALAAPQVQLCGDGLPRWLGPPGRAPLTWYLAHLAALAGLVVAAGFYTS